MYFYMRVSSTSFSCSSDMHTTRFTSYPTTQHISFMEGWLLRTLQNPSLFPGFSDDGKMTRKKWEWNSQSTKPKCVITKQISLTGAFPAAPAPTSASPSSSAESAQHNTTGIKCRQETPSLQCVDCMPANHNKLLAIHPPFVCAFVTVTVYARVLTLFFWHVIGVQCALAISISPSCKMFEQHSGVVLVCWCPASAA